MHASKSSLLLTAVALLGGSVSFAQVSYQLTPMSLPGGVLLGNIMDINNAGQVVGFVNSAGWIYDGRTGISTPTTGLGGSYYNATGITQAGVVVGSSYTPTGQFVPYTYDAGSVTNLGSGSLGTTNLAATGINESGDVIGTANYGSGDNRATLISGGTFTDLGNFGGKRSEATAINNSGQVTVVAVFDVNGTEKFRTYLVDGATSTDLGELGGGTTYATAINDSGVVVGNAYLAVGYQAFYYDGTLQTIGTLGGVFSGADDINAQGDIVGHAYTATSQDHGFLFTNGTMIDLNDTLVDADGWTVTEAFAINDVGEIAAFAKNGGTYYSVFLSPVSAVPEPSACALLLGLGVLGWTGTRRRVAR